MFRKLKKNILCGGVTIPIFTPQNIDFRRDGRVVECGGLENR